MKIAVLYICTGRYECFWDCFYRSCEKYFYPSIPKHYFVFTDSERVMAHKEANVVCMFQKRAGWPYDTLLRFHWFAMVQDKWKDFDFCYFCNANVEFKGYVTEEVIPLPDDHKPLVFARLTIHEEHDNSNDFTTEKNPESTAYVGKNVFCKSLWGAFNGGTAKAYLKMILELRDNVQKDLNKGIIAVWHDQSHLIHYGVDHPYVLVEKGIVAEQERNPDMKICRIMLLDKEKLGGKDNLRYSGIGARLRHSVIRVYKLVLKTANSVGLGNAVKKMAKLFPGRSEWYR